MKDLKHIHYFEELLDNANNSLVRQAVDDGRLAIGYTCHFTPEILMNMGNTFSVKLRAPNTGSLDISTYYLSSFLCGYSKAILERAIEGGYTFLSALIATETCSQMNRAVEHFELLNVVPDNDKFFVSIYDAPVKITENTLNFYESQIREHQLDPLNKVYGVDISDDAIRKAIDEHNAVCDIINEIGEFRKEKRPRITGTEFHILTVASYVCPKDLLLPYLVETLEEVKKRRPDPEGKYRARVVLVGSEMDDYRFTRLIEDAGAYVAADRYCFGSIPGRERINIDENETNLVRAIALHFLKTSKCPRFMSHEKIKERHTNVAGLVEEFNADGVIYETLKFCEFWGYEQTLASHVISEEYNIPTIVADRQYTVAGSGQLKTRVQAFVESLEIKKIKQMKQSV